MQLRIFAALALLLGATSADAVSPVADYQFNGTLASSISGAPDLATVGSGTQINGDFVNGTSQLVLKFTAGSGLLLSPTTSILSNPGVYTIRLLARHYETTSYEKYIDFSNLQDDVGLYDNSGYLGLYPEGFGQDLTIVPVYVEVVMTRDASGIAKGYINGVLQFIDDDSVNLAGFISNANTLYFFLDDIASGSGEVADGAVARITIWNTVLSDQEVAALEPDLIFAGDFDNASP